MTKDWTLTEADQRKNMLQYLGFSKHNRKIESKLKVRLAEQAGRGFPPSALFL